jgi:hypothetical protein
MRLSSRLPDLTPTELSDRLSTLARAKPLIDLCGSNPTTCGFAYPKEPILRALAHPEALRYAPDAAGLRSAREAVGPATGRGTDPADILLTASTSEAYALLFKAVCNPGDCVAVPAPSYPLFEHLARAEGVRVCRFDLHYVDAWTVDCKSLAQALEQGARAVVLVNPNNPTGSCISDAAAALVRELCLRHDALLISDEVFGCYPFGDEPLPSMMPAPAQAEAGPVTAVLDGLSKRAGLPQVKVGWIELYGPHKPKRALYAALEYLADNYLSVSTPAALAVPELLAVGDKVRSLILTRVRHNRALLDAMVATRPALERLAADGGWYALLRTHTRLADEALVLHLAEQHGVVVQPGFFYDFSREGILVVSLLAPPELFAQGQERLAAGLDAVAA